MAGEQSTHDRRKAILEKLQRQEFYSREEQVALQEQLVEITREELGVEQKRRAAAVETETALQVRNRRIGELTQTWLSAEKAEDRTAARAELDKLSAEAQAQSNP